MQMGEVGNGDGRGGHEMWIRRESRGWCGRMGGDADGRGQCRRHDGAVRWERGVRVWRTEKKK